MNEVRAYFISDLHLRDESEQNTCRFLNFLEQVKSENATHLFLVGDIFDLWIADHKYFIKRFSSVVSKLRELRDAGCEIHYFEGNHDLYLKKFWQLQLGFHVHSGPINVKLSDFHIRVEHGDQMDPDDKGYLFLRWFLRTPLMKWVAHQLPGRIVARIGSSASQTSRKYTSETKTISQEVAREKMQQHAQKAYAEQPFDFLISGHTHIQMDKILYPEKSQQGRLINLGTWLEQPVAFYMTDSDGQWMSLTQSR